MTSASGRKQSPLVTGRRGILEVEVAPVGETRSQRGRFGRFVEWLRDVLRLNDSQRATEDLREYIDQAREVAHEKLKTPGIKNAHMEAEIAQHLAQVDQVRTNTGMDERLFEDRQAHQRAQTEKLLAEAAAIDMDMKLKMIETIQRLGYNVVPIVRDGKLDSIYVSKELATRSIPLAEVEKPKRKRPRRRRP